MYVYNKRSNYLHKEKCPYVKQMNSKYKTFVNSKIIINNPHVQNVNVCSFCMKK